MSTGARMWRRSDGRGPLVLGHRGASAHATENTVAAFQRAAADGADGVELDVLCCGTGEVVVFHDDDLVRLAGRPERIRDMPLVAVREVTLLAGGGIPTLEQAFESCGPELLVNVELKTAGMRDPTLPALVDGVSQTIDRLGVGARVVVSSFSPLAVAQWRARRPDVKAGLLFERDAPLPLRHAWALPLLRPWAAHPDEALCTPATVRRWHHAGYAVSTWTVDQPTRLRALRDMGVDAIISNDPGAARAALDRNA